jgi:mRNA interferase MazF
VRRGEIWWARFPAPAGRRPVVLVSRNSSYAVRASCTVVEISSTIRGIDSEVPLGKRDGLARACVANADNLITIPKSWLERRAGALSAEKVSALEDAIRFSLELDDASR